MFLSPYRAIDLTGPLGFLTGKILADLGADVIKVEPPGGDPSRRALPAIAGADGTPLSTWWLAANAGKRSVTLDLAAAADRGPLEALVRSADFLL
jgi:benzylsuccinate CoA-transferase BbsE subunit